MGVVSREGSSQPTANLIGVPPVLVERKAGLVLYEKQEAALQAFWATHKDEALLSDFGQGHGNRVAANED
ncbi:hypothetical protein [Bradyrhizobium sp. 170]|uniref:hypothetical protein n=1 Tax=Bradyrhizobium sp. 170 TaxID=2782641 RepID=UPI001FFF2419|nr:hypothetical protein [Bradyrhizobium sp. 170]UPK04507.1 hypothetical protein IVB05_01790 [Bradyrhizobium sp. 170]